MIFFLFRLSSNVGPRKGNYTFVSRMSHVLPRYDRKPQAALSIRNVERNYDRRCGRMQLIRNKFCRMPDSP